jgi:hypothetical protein
MFTAARSIERGWKGIMEKGGEVINAEKKGITKISGTN